MPLDHAIKIHFFPEAAISWLQNQSFQFKKKPTTIRLQTSDCCQENFRNTNPRQRAYAV